MQGKRNRGHPPTRFIDHIKDLTGIRSVEEIMRSIENQESWRNSSNQTLALALTVMTFEIEHRRKRITLKILIIIRFSILTSIKFQ